MNDSSSSDENEDEPVTTCSKNITTKEEEDIQNIIKQANDVIINLDDCKLIYSQSHDEEILLSKYEECMRGIQIPTHLRILIPFYIKKVAHSCIKWLPFNSNVNVSRNIKRKQLNFLKTSNPALWICEEKYNVKQEKKEWIEMINNLKFPYSSLFIGDDLDNFILIEYSYINQPDGSKGLCGICMFECYLNNGIFKINDIANIKLSCNSNNKIYGNIFAFLNQHQNVPVFVYTPQNHLTRSLYNTYLFPWSREITSKGDFVINLITTIKMDLSTNEENKQLCIDNSIHSKSCAICNCLNIYLKLARNEYEPRDNHDTLNNTLIIPDLQHLCAYTKIIECKNTTFVTYAPRNPTRTTCKCKRK